MKYKVFRYLMKYADEVPSEVDHLTELLISEVYYLWCLAGGDLEELKKAGPNLQYAECQGNENIRISSELCLSEKLLNALT